MGRATGQLDHFAFRPRNHRRQHPARAAPGLGLECDKFDAAALDAHFDAFIGALLREVGPREEAADAGWNMLHIDSWEMGAQNWTAAFRDEFRRRRGYDPLRYLPAVTGRVVDSAEVSERFLWDLRQTAQELVIENHAQHLKDLGRQHGFGLSIEPYDMNPCADMSLGAVADVPMCEFWLYGFNTSYSVIEAASIAHTCGRPIVAAESFTSSNAERWQAYPGSMKTLGDWALCSGVNRIVFHRYQHQPWLDRVPGMTMGPYGVHWERTQTWWDMVPAYHAYLARCQYVLRQGLPVADICYLVAEGAPHVFRPPASATRGNPPERRGYNFDGCAPETLLTRMSVKDGRLVLPDGMSYRVLVLPEMQTITPALLRKIKELVAAGATVIGPRPSKSPSLSGYPACDQEVRELANELWGNEGTANQGSSKRLGVRRASAWSASGLPALADGEQPLNRHSPANLQRTSDVQGKREQAPRTPNASRVAEVTGAAEGTTLQLSRHRVGNGQILWQSNRAAEPDWTSTLPNPLEHAKWIWHREGNPAASAPVGKRYFRRNLALDENVPVESVRMFVTADNSFEVWVNGVRVGDGDNFHQAYELDVTKLLKPGRNALAIVAENGGEAPNPAGLIGTLFIKYRDGKTLEVPTNSKWQTANLAPNGWTADANTSEGWGAALELGPVGMGPWGAVTKPALNIEQYGDYSIAAGVLREMGVPPDFTSDGPLRYTHRSTDHSEIYFVANREDHWVAAECNFRVIGKVPELWDPLTGKITKPAVYQEEDGRVRMPLSLEPAGSVLVVFRKAEVSSVGELENDPIVAVKRNGQVVLPKSNHPSETAPGIEVSFASGGRISVLAWQPGRYELQTAKGKPTNFEVANIPASSEVNGPWEVRFQPHRGAPDKITLERLIDWSQYPDAGVKYFSGMATYRTSFNWTPAHSQVANPQAPVIKSKARYILDLGRVQVMARLKLNGQNFGVLWKQPFRVDITDALKAGENRLEITVANLWPNRLIGDQALPPDQRVTWTTWNPFSKDTPLLESGLLGPVTVQGAVEMTIRRD